MAKLTSLSLIAAVMAMTASAVSFQQGSSQRPPRDVRGTGYVAGAVVTTDGTPIAQATVRLMSSTYRISTTTTSDERGRFAFGELPVEVYHLRAEKPGFWEAYYGALRPRGDGTTIALAEGQRIGDLSIVLPRLGSITGTVRNQDLTPAAGVTVEATPKDGRGSAGVGHTDDRGAYRIPDLPAGDYKVRTLPAREATAIPVFHPSTTSPFEAANIRVEFGEERDRIDIGLVDEKPSRLAGVLVDLSGLPVPGIQVHAIPIGWGGGFKTSGGLTGQDGEFAFDSVFPGRYALRAYLPPAPGEPAADPATLWAAETVDVPLTLSAGVTLRLQPPLVFSGRVKFVGRAAPPSDLTRVRIDLHQDGWKPTSVDVRPDGSFARSVLPGSYVLATFVADAPEWDQRSARKDGRDLLDSTVEFALATGSLTEVEITLSDQHTSLSGSVSTAAGAPIPACSVIVFSTDRTQWREPFRRVVYRRPDTSGRFVFTRLPPGDYFIAAVANADPVPWQSTDFLEPLIASATRISLAEGQRRTHDIRVSGRSPGF